MSDDHFEPGQLWSHPHGGHVYLVVDAVRDVYYDKVSFLVLASSEACIVGSLYQIHVKRSGWESMWRLVV